ncbi:g_PROTEIN_RECEP_F3_4 domain-containing protein [Caerostris extrusa]|uniref:G_PROTEIN_RECEP_F3_4 domain-containing protein n=1 Tax=Caerostris extrusa TaxID=172846 RepID=A0AAV4NPW8_CAEEX|nr:g_PROTEIN_RECEP_F3_4 domain-containing protein [Caerostris extrusa]
MEQVMMTIGALESQLATAESNGSDIGFDIYDSCSNPSSSLIHLVDALRKVDSLRTDCTAMSYVGVIGPMNPKIQVEMEEFLLKSHVPYFPLQLASLRDEIQAMGAVLLELKWQSVVVFSSTKTLEDEFRQEADRKNICIASALVLSMDTRMDTLLRMKFQDLSLSGIQVAIVLGSHINLRKLYETAIMSNSSIRYWLLAGLDTKDSMLSVFFGSDHPGILFRKPILRIPNIDQSTVETYEFGAKISSLNLVQSYIEYVNGCINNSSESDLGEIQCQNHHLRAQNPQWSVIEETVEKLLSSVRQNGYLGNVTGTNKTVDMDNEQNRTSNEVEIWTFQQGVGKFSRPKELQVGHYRQTSQLGQEITECVPLHRFWMVQNTGISLSQGLPGNMRKFRKHLTDKRLGQLAEQHLSLAVRQLGYHSGDNIWNWHSRRSAHYCLPDHEILQR